MTKFYAGNVQYAAGTNTDPYNGGHHKSWSLIEDLKNENGIAYCQHPDFESSQPLSSTVGLDNYTSASLIPGNNGTLHTPAPLLLNGFNFNAIKDATAIKSVTVHYKQQTFENNGDVIDMGGATVTLMGANTSKTGTESVTTTLKEQKITFTNISKAQLLSSSFGVKIAYPMNGSARKCGRIILQDVYLEVLTGEPTIKYPQTITLVPGVECGGSTNYKCWDNLDNLKAQNGTAYCRNPSATDTPLIAGRNGTYNQPAPLLLYNFQFDLPTNAVVEKVVFHYKAQKFINNGYYPEFAGPTVTLTGTNTSAKTGKAISSDKVEDTITWTGVTVNQVNSSNFGIRLAYPSNSSTTPGRIILEDTYLEVYTNVDGVKVSCNSTFTKNPVTVGETFEGSFTVKKTSNPSCESTTVIDLPLGVDVVSKTSGTGTVTVSTVNLESYTFKRLTWKHTLVTGETSNTLVYQLRAVTPSANVTLTSNKERVKQCIMKDTDTQVSYTNTLTVNDIECSVTCTLSDAQVQLIANKSNKYNAVIKTNDPSKANKVLWINIGNNCELNTDDLTFTGYDTKGIGSNGNYWIRFADTTGKGTFTIPLNIIPTESGEYTINMWVTQSGNSKHISNYLSIPFLVRDKELGLLAFTRIAIPENVKQNMGHGLWYMLGSMIKYIQATTNYNITDYGANLRIGVFNRELEYVWDEDDFISHVIWSKDIATATSKEATVSFKYNEDNPLYFVYSHQYVGDPLNPYVVMNFSEPFLAEYSIYKTLSDRGFRIEPATALLGDTTYAEGTFKETITQAVPIDVYEWDDGGIFDEEINPLGITILFDYIVSDTVWVNVELYLDSNHVGSRDIIINKGKGTGVAGNSYDLFGLKPADFVDKLGQMEIRFTVINQLSNKAKVQINNVVANIKYVHRVLCGYGLTIDGESTKDYGIIVKEVEHNFATNNEKSEYHVTGTDDTIINRLNVDSKEITVTIFIPDCSLKENVYLIDRVVEMFTNNRELNSNKPIPKMLVFEHMPDRQFPVVRTKEFDDKIVGNSYEAKITLEVPEGTSYDIQKTVTGARGSSPSTIAIKPEVYYKANTAGRISIYESVLNQELLIEDSNIKQGSNVTIDADNRTVTLEDGTEITSSIDFNSNWFRLKGEYNFSSDTGTILSVEYYIRR